jgi:D-threo-aldose 1-dehydrogenase
MYGHGLSEARLGQALRWRTRDEFVLSTKVGRLLTAARRADIDFSPWVDGLPFRMHFDYGHDATMRSIEDSLQRTGLERFDIVFIHDCDVFTHGPERQPARFREAMDGAWKALERLRDTGVVKAIGVGVNEWRVCLAALRERDFDCFLLAGRYTLLEQDALDEFLPLCERRGAAVVLGGGYNSGILATGAGAGAKYNYGPAPAPILEKTRRIEAVCARHGVPLKAAALQFVLAHPAIPTNVPGTRTVAQMNENLAIFRTEIPAALWAELKHAGLIRRDAPTPA